MHARISQMPRIGRVAGLGFRSDLRSSAFTCGQMISLLLLISASNHSEQPRNAGRGV